ncbi:MAG: hypothetical protein Q7I97_08255 [Thermovirgaceae bacterium]|nr:hypothetical protein [Thermovirgaceae bacterium]
MLNRKTWVFALATLLVFCGAAFASIGSQLVGTYSGVFTGPENYGSFLVTVNPDGSINGTGRSQVYLNDLVIEGTARPDGTTEFYTVGGADIPIMFKGRIDFMNRLLGKWSSQDNNAWGSFNAMIQ